MRPAPSDVLTKEQVLEQLEDIKKSGQVKPRELAFLAYVVQEALAGRGDAIKEYTVGVEALGLPRTFDPNAPKASTLVRTTALALRKQLGEYYAGVERWRVYVKIDIPKGGYRPFFSKPDVAERLGAAEEAALRSAQVAADKITLPALQAALDYLDKILIAYPQHPLVLAMKADVHSVRAMHGLPPRQEIETAETLARQAVELDPNLWQAQIAYGYTQAVLSHWTEAKTAFNRAVKTMPSDIPPHFFYVTYLISQGETEKAIQLGKQSVESAKGYYGSAAPSTPIVRSDLAFYQILGGHLEDAKETLTSALNDSDFYLLHVYRALLQEAMDDPKGAASFIHAAPLKWSESAITWGMLALYYGLAGDRWRARLELTKLWTAKKLFRFYVPASQFALAYIGLGQHQRAVHWVGQMAEDRDPALLWLGQLPFLRHLAHLPEFNAILSSLGLSWQWKPRGKTP